MLKHLLVIVTATALLSPLVVAAEDSRKPESKSKDAKRVSFYSGEAEARESIEVQSSAFSDNEKIPEKHTAYGDDISPPLSWSGVPEGAKSLVLMMEDPDAAEPKPFVHWLLYNLPPDMTSLPEGLPKKPALEKPENALQGETSKGVIGYFGPKPPPWDVHHYHFQVFALDKVLDLKPAAKREDLLREMAGHVVAKGLLVGTYQIDKKKE